MSGFSEHRTTDVLPMARSGTFEAEASREPFETSESGIVVCWDELSLQTPTLSQSGIAALQVSEVGSTNKRSRMWARSWGWIVDDLIE